MRLAHLGEVTLLAAIRLEAELEGAAHGSFPLLRVTAIDAADCTVTSRSVNPFVQYFEGGDSPVA
jgi:hypothetical protein